MPANTTPIFGVTPNLGTGSIATTAALTRSDGVGVVNSTIFPCFTAGTFGSFVQKVRFFSSANTPTTGVATVLRVFIGYVNTPGATLTDAGTTLIGELSVPAVPSANATNAANFYDLPLNFALPAGMYMLVAQHTAQTTNQHWNALTIGSDY